MLSTASRGAPRARALHSRRASVSCTTCQQRAYRFGPWAPDDVGSSSNKEGKRCHRGFRYRYMETINSKSWGEEPQATEADPALVTATELLKQSMESQPTPQKGPKHINIQKNLKPDDTPGTRPGQNIEDVERDAINHLFDSYSGHTNANFNNMWKRPLNNVRNILHPAKAPKDVTPSEVLDATTTATEVDEGQIDPITNRRKSKQAASNGESSTFTPKFEDVDHHPNLQADKTPNENYEKVQWNEPDGLPRVTREEKSKQYDDLDKYKPQKWNEPDGLPEKTTEEESKKYKDLGKYKAVQWNEPNGLQMETPEELSKNYNDLGSYGEVKWNEPDGLQKQTPEELSKSYTDLNQYGAVRWNEPDGLQKPTPEELSKDYEDLNSYDQVKWNEPDGLRKLTPEEQSKAYSDLDNYDGPRTAKDSIIQDYEAIQMDTTVKGNELPPKVEVATEEPGKEYTDLGEYKAVYWNEPDGLRKPTPEELSKNYEDLHLYGQVKWNEPDGLPDLTPEEQSKLYKDLPGYSSRGFSGQENYTARRHPEEISKEYEDLSNYGTPLIDDVDSPYHVHPEEASKKYGDLSKYAATYGSKTEHVHPEELTKNYSDLDRYDPQNFDSPAPAEPPKSGEASNSYSDLGSYTQRSQPQGISSKGTSGQSSGDNDGSDGKNGSKLDNLTPDEIRANVLRRVRKQNLSKEQHRQAAAAVYRNTWDPIMEEAHEKLARDHPRKLTGNYARDFPEEFTTSWGTTNSSSQSTLFPKNKAERIIEFEAQPREELEPSSMDESFPNESSRLEPALDRQARQNSTAPVSQEPSEEPASSDARFQQAIKDAEEKLLAQQSPSKSSPFASSSVKSDAPATYKILAYDPTTDLIRTAETSSSVNDTSCPLTPADVIPKLSNPAKFFVHFSGLQAEGYEIVSGERDVLVFRKSRSSAPKSDTPSRINPIDMMGKPPITGNFASPTGFVNYDSLEEPNPKPEPPFRSNINVRREEPVYSGPKETGVGKEKKKKGLGRRVIIGTAYVAGGAYAVGVMGEYFATRGAPPRPGVEPMKRRM